MNFVIKQCTPNGLVRTIGRVIFCPCRTISRSVIKFVVVAGCWLRVAGCGLLVEQYDAKSRKTGERWTKSNNSLDQDGESFIYFFPPIRIGPNFIDALCWLYYHSII